MSIYDSPRPSRRIFGADISYGNSRGSVRELPSLSGLFRWAIILTVLLLMVSGCGRKELEDAKQQIDKLNAENKRLTELSASLDKDKNRLSEGLKTSSLKNSQLQRQLDDLNRSKAALTDENKKLKEKGSAIEEEIASSKREKSHQALEIEDLKKRLAGLAPPPQPPAAIPSETGPVAKAREEFTPCDAIIEFMKASEQVVRQQRGNERTKSLEEVKKQYAVRMQGAPAKAIKAAEDWVKEGTKFWDQSPDDAVLRLLELRNVVLDACGKSPDTSGFR